MGRDLGQVISLAATRILSICIHFKILWTLYRDDGLVLIWHVIIILKIRYLISGRNMLKCLTWPSLIEGKSALFSNGTVYFILDALNKVKVKESSDHFPQELVQYHVFKEARCKIGKEFRSPVKQSSREFYASNPIDVCGHRISQLCLGLQY